MNKKGGEKYFSVWWFLVLLVVGGCVVYATNSFLSTDQDIRFLEAGALYTQVENCIVKDNILDISIFDEGYDFYTNCSLNKEILNQFFYVGISLKEGNVVLNKTSFGKDFSVECGVFLEGTSAENYPRCVSISEEIFFILDGVKRRGTLEIVAGSNNHGNKMSWV